MKEFFLSWGMLIISVIFNVYGVFVFKLRLNECGEIPLNSIKSLAGYIGILLKSPLLLSAVVLFFIAPFLFAVSLSRMQLSIAYPVQVGLNFVCVFLLALFFLGEQLTIYKIFGVLFVFLGMYLLNKI